MKLRLLFTALTITGAAAFAAVPAAADAAVSGQSAVSENWSGYAASDSNGSGQFSSVSGSWVEPTVNCSTGTGYDAFWVGLGGASQQSDALEQIGTQAACSGSGTAQHFAWYELVPSGPVRLGVTIKPGDHITGKVTVDGTSVTVSLRDDTTGQSTTKTLQMSNPDTSSAEWIAEAPSQCDSSGNCQPMPLADFGSVDFTDASATAGGQTGSISAWNAQPVQLESGSDFVSSGAAGTSQAGAQPSSLSSDGSAFSVQWLADSSASDSSQPGSQSGAGGYPGGDGGYPGGYGGYGGYGGGYPGGYGSGGYSGGYGYGGGYGYSYGGQGVYLYGY
jgi:Peptidase A4 family